MAAVIVTAPVASNPRPMREARSLVGTSLIPAIRAIRATGAGRKNTQRQPASVRSPPMTSPSEKPVAPVAV